MPTDEALVAQVAHGDEQALAELLRRWERPLAHFLHRRTGGRDVEDLYQEVWLRVVRAAERFDGDRRFSTWLFQIALNLSRDWRRREPAAPGGVDPGGEAAAPIAADASAGVDVERLLARLPAAQREVVALRYLHDLSEDEVATLLDIPRGTVKSRLHHAIARLNALVRGEDTP
ncbi:MAG TPA: sigma-70 family RNA polymerase sigma factor [Candidatus Dormibacteraeota bacterium]|nr:sigma-70 family RNA polymerase sigma factor [Candidatus Dormibacteraeota bacterium]